MPLLFTACTRLLGSTLLDEGDVGLGVIEEGYWLLDDLNQRRTIRQLHGLRALQSIGMNLNLVLAAVGHDSVHTPLFQFFDHLWSVLKLLFAVDANLIKRAVLVVQPNRIQIATLLGTKRLKNDSSDFTCWVAGCGKEVDLKILRFKNDIELE